MHSTRFTNPEAVDDLFLISPYTFAGYRVKCSVKCPATKFPSKSSARCGTPFSAAELEAGDRLPPEKELLVQFGVSKHTLREALRALEIMGLIDIRKGAGGGPVVMEVGRETIRNSIANFLHFKDVSFRICPKSGKCWSRIWRESPPGASSRRQLEKLRSMNAACRKTLGLGKNITGGKDEIDFHILLAETSDNPVLVLILDFVNSLLAEIKKKLKPGLRFRSRYWRLMRGFWTHCRPGTRAGQQMRCIVMSAKWKRD